MQIKVKRIKQGKNSTLSEIYINGQFFCYGLEDTVREVKIRGSTAIPAGEYALQLNTYGAMNARYKRRFPEMHRGMIEIMDIPDFKYVYIHIGNTYANTSGCLLVGMAYELVDGDYELRQSQKTYVTLYQRIVNAVRESSCQLSVVSDIVTK